ncbi:hypothetical protein C8J57DRAFT_1491391 [Mycena rebaudengoi]|nr:hypothetical protein C8J57DRAFT_1491391 [Mycena rebaudengoi]
MHRSGLSRGSKISYGTGRLFTAARDKQNTFHIKTNRTGAEIAKERRIFNNQLSSLSFTQHEALIGDDLHPHAANISSADWVDLDSDEEEALRQFPPGEEAMLMSHAGQESTVHQIMEGVKPEYRGDLRIRDDRVQKVVDSWKRQLPNLINAYLEFKYQGPRKADQEDHRWGIPVIGFEENGIHQFSYTSPSETANVALVLHGFIGSAPEKPGIAFPLQLFEIYRQIHRVCPRFTLDGLSKTLTHLHKGPRKSSLHDQLVIAYDAYLSIIHGVEARSQAALGRTDTWYMENRSRGTGPILMQTHTSATASLLSDRSVSATLSVSASASVTDTTPPVSATPSTIDPAPAASTDEDMDDVAWLNINELDSMDVTKLTKCIYTCVDRWRNTGPEQHKKMFALFAVAGIFLVVCRHGHVVIMCDMIRSGELMKYPLAMVKRILDRYGKDVGLGSLGHRVVGMNLRGVVPAFHGHAHNRACQVGWHPLYVEGVGLEDFEECECTFAKSNHLASSTRLTTAFHRKQALDEHFYFHDLDKHALSGNFIYQNYRQAIEKIAINRAQLELMEARLNTTAQDYEDALRSEQEYFRGLRTEPAEISSAVEYMELLMKLHMQSEDSEAAKVEFRRLDHDIIHNNYTTPQISRVRTRYHTTYSKYLATLEEVCRFEELNKIEERWMFGSQKYTDALLVMKERRYKKAVSDLEHLVVQRLFEMTKLGMSSVGYKLHEKISQALKTRAKAIRKALERYNAAAAALDPPRPRLAWNSIVSNATLAEFDWLRETRQDIRELTWVQPVRCEAMLLYFGIKRAEEEKIRLNVEIRRLITAMLDDHVDFYRTISALLFANPTLAFELSQEYTFHSQINTAITKRLALTSRLVGFTGSLFPGDREGRDESLREGVPPPAWLAQVLHLTTITVNYEEQEDDSTTGMSEVEQQNFHANGLAREEDFDESLVIELMETLSTNDNV